MVVRCVCVCFGSVPMFRCCLFTTQMVPRNGASSPHYDKRAMGNGTTLTLPFFPAHTHNVLMTIGTAHIYTKKTASCTAPYHCPSTGAQETFQKSHRARSQWHRNPNQWNDDRPTSLPIYRPSGVLGPSLNLLPLPLECIRIFDHCRSESRHDNNTGRPFRRPRYSTGLDRNAGASETVLPAPVRATSSIHTHTTPSA